MNLFKRKTNRIDQPQEVNANFAAADLGYKRLEKRQVLSASFIAGASGLILDSFDPGQDLTFGQETTSVNGSLQESYLFVLESGSWTGSDADPLIELESVNGGVDNRLEVATAFFGGTDQAIIEIDGLAGTENVEFNRSSSFLTFDSLTVSNFTNFDRSFEIVSIGDVTVGNISVLDSDPSDGTAASAQIQIDTLGSITTTGTIENLIDNEFDDIILTASGQDNDIIVGGKIETRAGIIGLRADDSVNFDSSANVIANGFGTVQIESGFGMSFGNSGDEIRMEDGASINSDLGRLNLISENDIYLVSVSSNAINEAVFVFSGGNIFDNSTSELDNAVATNGRVRMVANGDIGAADAGDIDVQAKLLQFSADNDVFISDSEFGVTIDRFSRAGGTAQIQSSHFLEISRGIDVGESSKFSSGNSSAEGDDLIINRNATVTLDSSDNGRLDFVAGDNIVFDSGGIVTTGGGVHGVTMIADAEGTIDSDRGSISNSMGFGPSVRTNDLDMMAFDGIGNLNDAPLRIDADRLVALNEGFNDIRITETNSIELVDVSTHDGSITVTAFGNIDLTSVVSGEAESNEDDADDVEITSTTGVINVSNVQSADDLVLHARSKSITDTPASRIVAGGNASFEATDQIKLADDSSDLLRIENNASFSAATVDIGHDFRSAGDPTSANTFLGSVTVVAVDALVVEDDATQFAGTSRVRDLYLASAGDITNTENAELTLFGHAQLVSPDQIVLGNQTGDQFDIASIGMVTPNVHLETDANLIIDATVPDQSITVFGTEFSHGTEVAETLFITSTGSVTQPDGVLNAKSIAVRAEGHVHLAKVIASNDSIAISADTASALTDVDMIQEIRALDQIENSEVRSSLPQSIAVKHHGTMNITSVESHLGTESISGFQTTDGGIFASAVGDVNLIENVDANSPSFDPQVTIYSESGTAKTPAIHFVGGVIQVNGPSNEGIVNANQTVATFFDADDEVLKGTTELLLLATDGTALQDIVIDYGHAGESGYRVGIVWDRDNQLGEPVEVINTFVSDPLVGTEAYDDEIFNNNPNSIHLIGDNEGGRETFPKIFRYSKSAIISHNDEPNVFSEVTVRNDQDINLYSGSLASVTNSLNETSETLRAELDVPKKSAPTLPKISKINPIEVKSGVLLPTSSSSQEISSSFSFSRDVQPFETGDLKWVQVTIPISELDETDGEVRLKDPTRIFGKSEFAEIIQLDAEIGDNEVDKIIKAIETNEKSEAGYWYKVFKDYRNRDDELFFYHYKTGEAVEVDSEPAIETVDPTHESTHEESNSQNNPAEPETKPSDFEPLPIPETSQPDVAPGLELNPPMLEQDEIETLPSPLSDPVKSELTPSSSSAHGNDVDVMEANSLSAASLMMATLMIRKSKTEHPVIGAAQKSECTEPKENDLEAPIIGFSRLDRLKRKAKRIFG